MVAHRLARRNATGPRPRPRLHTRPRPDRRFRLLPRRHPRTAGPRRRRPGRRPPRPAPAARPPRPRRHPTREGQPEMPTIDITVIGNLAGDPELRFTSAGTPVASFTVASNERYQQGGEW